MIEYFYRKNNIQGGISYVCNYTKDLWRKQEGFTRRLKKVFNGEDISSLTGAIKDFTDIMGKELLSEIVTQVENLVFDDAKMCKIMGKNAEECSRIYPE